MIGIPIFILAIIIVFISMSIEQNELKIVGVSFAFLGMVLIMVAFFFDFKNTMIKNETKGDEFTFMTKEQLISILEKNNIEYEKDKGREYYLYLVREYIKK